MCLFLGWSAGAVDKRTLVPCVRRFAKESQEYDAVHMTTKGQDTHENDVAEKDKSLPATCQYNV